MNFETMTKGTLFTFMGVRYEFVRNAGTCQTANRNQWGRSTGGTHTAHKIAVKVDKRHRGWSPVHYTAFPIGFDSLIKPVED